MSENSNQYQYTHVELETVMNNIDEYIMPELQEACKKLWSKNIETFMVSNNDDDHLYILMETLSDENMDRLDKLMDSYPNFYFFDEFRHYYGIKTEGRTKEDSQILLKLTEPFVIQDVLRNRYQTAEDFLEKYKHFTIDDVKKIQEAYGLSNDDDILIITERGNVGVNPQYKLIPERENATLEEALENTGKRYLYDENEKRVYTSRMYMDWHKRYCMSKSKNRESYDHEDI